jgi:hypothetical protein
MSFHASFFFFNSLFFVVNYIFTLILSFVSFCFFQVTMHCLYSSYPYCFCFICCSNPNFSPSTLVNLVFNDLISKLKLPILWLTITIAWNIIPILLITSQHLFYQLLYKLCGVSSLDASFDDIPLSFIYKPISIFNPCPYINPSLLCDNIMAGGLKLLNVDYNITVCGSWDGCGYFCSISGCVTYMSIGASWWMSICAWKSYKSSTSSYCMCSC